MRAFLVAGLSALLVAACGPSTAVLPDPKPGTVDHVVIFWLKRPGNGDDKERLHAAAGQLEAIPGVLAVRHGNVIASDREIVDDSFDLAYIITFDSVESLRAYDPHPIHAKLAAEVARPLCRKILVYDVIH
ncbi:stress responsive barrel domain protein [Haloferula helveola]|uniref:Stress responsive barrel domain protein n=1 Tax=Haloferula helveola TaxID=490095 RepID=A0ABM7R9L8_9BACT|nr:stress responsive barrel domain protein [Haloferula helveola]